MVGFVIESNGRYWRYTNAKRLAANRYDTDLWVDIARATVWEDEARAQGVVQHWTMTNKDKNGKPLLTKEGEPIWTKRRRMLFDPVQSKLQMKTVFTEGSGAAMLVRSTEHAKVEATTLPPTEGWPNV